VRLKPDTTTYIAPWGGPDCTDLRSMPLHVPEIARSESSASTSDRVHAGARSTTEGPIAPDRLRHELAGSRRACARVPSRSAISRPAEPASQTGMTAPSVASMPAIEPDTMHVGFRRKIAAASVGAR
jgi:hypothetical protein